MIGNGHAGFGRAASEKDPQGHLAGVVPRHAAIPARSRGNGPGNGFAKRCADGERATALRRRPTTGPAPTHAGAEAKRSHDYKPKHGPHRQPSPICTGPGRRPAPTPSTAPEHPRVSCRRDTDARLRLALGADAHRKPEPSDPGAGPGERSATRETGSCACRSPRIGPPASTSATPATSTKQARSAVPPDGRTLDDTAMPKFGDEQGA